jgi:hypothetical protein
MQRLIGDFVANYKTLFVGLDGFLIHDAKSHHLRRLRLAFSHSALCKERAKIVHGRQWQLECASMCDYSLEHVKSRPAKVGDKLTTRDFGRVTRGFAAAEDKSVAVCVLPGTELSFASEVVECARSAFVFSERVINHKTAIFRRVNQQHQWDNHDALEFPDGQIVLLTFLLEDQEATVLQLPAAEKQPASSAENKNAPIAGQLVDFILT